MHDINSMFFTVSIQVFPSCVVDVNKLIVYYIVSYKILILTHMYLVHVFIKILVNFKTNAGF